MAASLDRFYEIRSVVVHNFGENGDTPLLSGQRLIPIPASAPLNPLPRSTWPYDSKSDNRNGYVARQTRGGYATTTMSSTSAISPRREQQVQQSDDLIPTCTCCGLVDATVHCQECRKDYCIACVKKLHEGAKTGHNITYIELENRSGTDSMSVSPPDEPLSGGQPPPSLHGMGAENRSNGALETKRGGTAAAAAVGGSSRRNNIRNISGSGAIICQGPGDPRRIQPGEAGCTAEGVVHCVECEMDYCRVCAVDVHRGRGPASGHHISYIEH